LTPAALWCVAGAAGRDEFCKARLWTMDMTALSFTTSKTKTVTTAGKTAD
jgi:hypothetical protein